MREMCGADIYVLFSKRKIQYQWFVFWSGLFDWLIFSVSLFVIADKLGWQKKRDA